MSGASFHYVNTRPRSCPQPVGFYRYKAGQVFKPTLPPPQNGTHVKLHQNLSKRYTRADTCKDTKAYGPAFRILYKQRVRQRIFTAQAPADVYGKSATFTNKKLCVYDPTQHPPESTILKDALFYPHNICNKPLYSKEEVENIVNRLYTKKQREGRCPMKIDIDQNRRTFPAEMVDKMAMTYGSTTKLCLKTPYRNLFRDRIAAHVVCSEAKTLTEPQFDTMVDRLNEFDTQKWPPNSTAVETEEPESPVKIKYPPPPGRMSSASVEATVDRLYSGKWRSTESSTGGGTARYSRSPDMKSPHRDRYSEREQYTENGSTYEE